MTRCHSLSVIVIFSYSLSFLVIRCHLLHHSLSLAVSFVVICCTTRCHSLYHSLSFVLPLVVICYHSFSFDVTRCTTRLSFYKRSLFYNFLLFTSFIIKAKTKKILSLMSEGDNYLKIKQQYCIQSCNILVPRADEMGVEGRRPRMRAEGRGWRNTNTLNKIVKKNDKWLHTCQPYFHFILVCSSTKRSCSEGFRLLLLESFISLSILGTQKKPVFFVEVSIKRG